MKNIPVIFTTICCFFLSSCSGENDTYTPIQQPQQTTPPPSNPVTYKYLALGDSYTIGQSVCETCSYPEQLKTRFAAEQNVNIDLKIIATTGWTTTDLITAINAQNPTSDYDFVTLLIGVNNQYQNKPFSLYEQEFPQLANTAVAKAKGIASNVVVISIPDYRYTPYGNGVANPEAVSQQIDQYNAFAKNYCDVHNITFIDITDITRLGLQQPELVTTDGLHPSQIAYAKFVERILPVAISKLSD